MKFRTEINFFRGDDFFLSNFYESIVRLWISASGEIFAHEMPDCTVETYKYVETAYQAAKSLDREQRKVFTMDFNPNLKPGQAKRMGAGLRKRGLERPDWKQVNVGLMRELLIQKFTYSILRRKLLGTMTAKLIEGNHWHDIFYGVCMGELEGRRCKYYPHEPVGENILGQLLMEVRTLYVVPKLPEQKTVPLQQQEEPLLLE